MSQSRFSRIQNITISSFLLLLASCGDTSSNYVPTRDSIETEASIQFSPTTKTIAIVEAGASVRSTILAPCEISVETKALTYEFFDDQTLILNGNPYKRARSLDVPESLPGIPSAIFAVWSTEAKIYEQVSNQIEIEVHVDRLVYRNNCAR